MTKLSVVSFFLILGLSQQAQASGAHLPNFREVENGKIYRGGVPTSTGVEQLSKMGVKTILSIRDDDPVATKKEGKLARGLGMEFISIPLSGILSPSDAKIDAIESILNNPKYYPLYVHCTYGQDRTGLVIGLFRVFFQNVSPKDAYQEMLALGFKRMLVGLRHYFESRTGYDTDDVTLQASLELAK